MSQPYRDQPWNARFGKMGDQAETVFEEVRPLGPFIRFGWNRPQGISVTHMPVVLRHKPDYYAAGSLIEVVGLGKDGILKLKVSKYEALKLWRQLMAGDDMMGQGGEILLFVWNSHKKMYALLSWEEQKQLVAAARREGIKEFNDGNRYFPIPWDSITAKASWVEAWQDPPS